MNPKILDCKICSEETIIGLRKKLDLSLYCMVQSVFNILNCFRVTHECKTEQTDGQTDGHTEGQIF